MLGLITELNILCWSEHSQCKLLPTSATAHYSSPDNTVGLVLGLITELNILCWSEHSQRKLLPTSATAHYSSPDNTVGLVAQCEVGGYVKLGWLLEAVGQKFCTHTHTPANPAVVCYVNMPTCAAINLKKHFKGCGKTFRVYVKYLYYDLTYGQYAAVRGIRCTYSVHNRLQLG